MAGQETVRPVNFSGSLSQFKNVTTNGFGPQQYVGPVAPGGTAMPTPNRGADTGMFAGSGTPLNSSIGMQDTSRKHVTNVIKSLAIQEIGGDALAYGVSKAAVGIQKSGIVNRAINAARGETMLVHGSPLNDLKSIQPSIGSARFPEENVAYGWNPKSFYPDDAVGLTNNATQYTGNLSSNPNTPLRGTMRSESPGGSVYITRGKTAKNIVTDPNEGFMMAIKGETPVVQEFKVGDYYKTEPNPVAGKPDVTYMDKKGLTSDIKASLKRSGVKVEPNIAQKLLDKAEAAKLAKRARIANQNSVV